MRREQQAAATGCARVARLALPLTHNNCTLAQRRFPAPPTPRPPTLRRSGRCPLGNCQSGMLGATDAAVACCNRASWRAVCCDLALLGGAGAAGCCLGGGGAASAGACCCCWC